jgi:hypothetical protein
MIRLHRVQEAVIGNIDFLYHGTSNTLAGEKILKERRLLPGVIVSSNKSLAPKAGAVYLSPSLRYAVIYAVGGDMMGHALSDYMLKSGFIGYLFSIEVSKLEGKIEADEDSIGEMAFMDKLPFLKYMLSRVATPLQMKKGQQGEYNVWAAVGKKLSKLMTPEQHLQVILAGGHVSHFGEVPISHAWSFDKNLNVDLKKDVSNFFELAAQVL